MASTVVQHIPVVRRSNLRFENPPSLDTACNNTSDKSDLTCYPRPLESSQVHGENIASVKKVAILLCTYDGEQFLAPQLDSLWKQIHTNWVLHVSDDGSTDGTQAILDTYTSHWGKDRITRKSGPRKGFVTNFLSLACDAETRGDYFAFCDQDDIWEADKLARAVAWLDTVEEGCPAVYCSRTRLIDVDNSEIGLSPLFAKPPSFENALVQSLAGGNTMVFNTATRDLLKASGMVQGVVSHDWWVYLVVTACRGKVRYDATPSVRYRQHSENLVGANTQWPARLSRFKMLLQGRFRLWNDVHLAALAPLAGHFSSNTAKVYAKFSRARNQSLVKRMLGFARCKIYRQTFIDNVALLVAAIFNKI